MMGLKERDESDRSHLKRSKSSSSLLPRDNLADVRIGTQQVASSSSENVEELRDLHDVHSCLSSEREGVELGHVPVIARGHYFSLLQRNGGFYQSVRGEGRGGRANLKAAQRVCWDIAN